MIVVIAIADARKASRAGVDAVSGKALAAIVERRRSRPALNEKSLRAQAAVLGDLEARGLTILPVRFGTTVRDEAELKALLEPMERTLKPALKLIEGRRQMTVRVRGARAAAPRSSGRAYLAARAKAARVAEADPVRRAAKDLIVAEQTGPGRGPFSAAVYHLVDARNVERYLAVIEKVERRSPGRFVVSGPMPAFAFTPVTDLGGDA